MDSTKIRPTVNEAVEEIRYMIKDFLNGKEGSPKVREHLRSVVDNDALLLIYLKGRKYRPKHAWETLKRKAEVRFNDYPDVFPETIPDFIFTMLKDDVMGILKGRDNLGRRIAFFNPGKWNPSKVSSAQLCTAGICSLDHLICDEDVQNNGIILIHNTAGVGFKQAKEYTLPHMLRVLNIFWYSYPVKVKGLYFINVPSYLLYIYKLIKPFFSKKLQQRFIVSTNDKQFEVLHEHLPPNVLPKSLGGSLENKDSIDFEFLQNVNLHIK